MTFGGGNRIDWSELPEPVRTRVERQLGGRVVAARTAAGGFTPGLAATVTTAGGTTAFVKAIHASLTPEGPSFHRREIAIASALPPATPAPRLLWSGEQDGWVLLVLEHVEGRSPDPARADELQAVLTGLERLAAALTPSPVDADRLVDAGREQFTGWRSLLDRPRDVAGYGADVVAAVPRLADLEQGWEKAADGESLLHGDLRVDNMLLTESGTVLFVDWPHACVGAPWADLVIAMPSLVMQGVDPERVVASSALTRDVDREDLDAMAVATAGFFVAASLEAPLPGLPTLRRFQQDQGLAALRWLRARGVL